MLALIREYQTPTNARPSSAFLWPLNSGGSNEIIGSCLGTGFPSNDVGLLIREILRQWATTKKIVSMDPLGHLAPWLFADLIRTENIHIRPTIAITKAHMKLPELETSVRAGRLVPDRKICLNETGELAVTKFAVEPGKHYRRL